MAAVTDPDGVIAAPDSVRAMLQGCANGQVRAIVLSTVSLQTTAARFSKVGRQVIELELRDEPIETSFLPLALCVVSFFYQERSCVFLSTLFQYNTAPNGVKSIELALPAHLLAEQPRSAYRVPIINKNAIRVRVQVGGNAPERVEAVNISFTGIRLVMPSALRSVAIGDPVNVELTLGAYELNLVAVVRRREGSQYGLFFADVMQDGEINPPDELMAIVRELERQWIVHQRGLR